jgi:hypothetical protein
MRKKYHLKRQPTSTGKNYSAKQQPQSVSMYAFWNGYKNYICKDQLLMHLTKVCLHILSQLENLVNEIDPIDFQRPSGVLNGSTIGQHLRHTLEFFICFANGCEKGVVNYDKRSHDELIQSDKFIALATIRKVRQSVLNLEADRNLILEISYGTASDIQVETNTSRELIYNIEHAVHHMAIMKIGLREIAPYIPIPNDFGVASSTLRYKENAGTHVQG